jgi:hypothetical protein
LVHYLETSRKQWKNTDDFIKGWEEVKLWRAQLSTAKSEEKPNPATPEELPETAPRAKSPFQPREQQTDLRHHSQPNSSRELLMTSGSSANLAVETEPPKSKEDLHEV